MKLCQSDLEFWTAKCAPKWAHTLLKNPPNTVRPLQYAINQRAGLQAKCKAHLEPSNAVAVLKMVRRRGEDLYSYMTTAAVEYKRVQPERANTYQRWLRRLERSRLK